MKTMLKFLILSLCILFNASQGMAQEPGASERKTTEAEIDEEFRWLQAEAIVMTEIATHTKMDADMVPGMVTILGGDDLRDRGIRTVYEALSLVPGINTYLNGSGNKHVSVRGSGGSFFSGNLKLMLNSSVLNDSLTAAGNVIYGLPVEQVDRIEVIRGPGAVIYGEYAYAGVINVITRDKGNRLYATYGSHERYGGGGTATLNLPEKDFSLSASFSGWESDVTGTRAGEDRLYSMGLGDFSYAPGRINDAQEYRFANLSLKYGNFSLLGQYLSDGGGDYFGIIHILPPQDDRIIRSEEHWNLEARQTVNFSDAFKADFKAGWRQYEFNIDEAIGLPFVPGISPPEGSLAGPHYEEREGFGSAELIWDGGNRHVFLLGAKYASVEMRDVWADANTSDDAWGSMIRMRGDANWMSEDQGRHTFSLYLQDVFAISEHVTLTGGLRYDHYSDMGDAVTPRLSAVWHLADAHILKAQYSEACRPPTFTELYSRSNTVVAGNEHLDSERIRSYELGYVYRALKTVGRVTLFWSELDDNIEYPKYADTISGSVQYRNADKVTMRGFELEFGRDLTRGLRVDANFSFSDTEDDESGEEIDGGTNWLWNVGLQYEPSEDYLLTLRYRYVGERHRTADDDRDAPDACHTLDVAASIRNLFMPGLTLRAGAKNLFDTEVLHPAPVYKDSDGNIQYYYPDDFPGSGREFWVQLSYDFN